MMPSGVLAYSGGWIPRNFGMVARNKDIRFDAVYVDLGQPCEDRKRFCRRPWDIGVESCQIIDVREELCRDFAFPVLAGMQLMRRSTAGDRHWRP